MNTIERIKELMKNKNITVNELLQKTSIKRSTFYYILSNEENLKKTNIETLRAIAIALNVSLDFLINGKQTDEAIPEDIQGMFRQVKDFSVEDRKALARIIGKMSKHLNE